jgi:diadenosine tetraphosphate (Ap4A) HIT family hydrolase
MTDAEPCLACDLTAGRQPLPGGPIHGTTHWTVEHCLGPLRVGTLIVKPLRHVTRFAGLTPDEAADFGPLLLAVTRALAEELGPDQTYVCEWSHAGWVAGHIHFVVQPAWNRDSERFEHPGPFTQVEMFGDAVPLDEAEVNAFCDRIRRRLAHANTAHPDPPPRTEGRAEPQHLPTEPTDCPSPAQRERGQG